MKNISFCGCHPRSNWWNAHQLRDVCFRWVTSRVISSCCPSPPLCSYFGFITKHPMLNRFACHVFVSQESMRPVAECVGWAQITLFFLSTARCQLVLTAIPYRDELCYDISHCLCLFLLQTSLPGILPGASRIRLPHRGHLPGVRRNAMAATFFVLPACSCSSLATGGRCQWGPHCKINPLNLGSSFLQYARH